MVGRQRCARALGGAWALTACSLLAPAVPASAIAPAVPAVAPAAAPDAAPEPLPDDAPLALTIRTLTPASLPAVGDITLTGTVTNRTDETWTDIDLYVIAGDEDDGVPVDPMRNPGQLQLAMETPADEVVGFRKTGVGTPGEVAELAPGASADYTVVVPSQAIEVSRAGVYWFGVHALGGSPSQPEDGLADGRARTFLPFVPRRFDPTPVRAAVVIPLTQPVRYAADGSIDDVEAWTRALGPEGRLTRLLDLAAASRDPLTWLVDPALVDAVAHLAAGNVPRDLGPTPGDPDDEPTDGQSDEPGNETDGQSDAPQENSPDPADDATEGSAELPTDLLPLPASAQVAARWLTALGEALRGDQVLAVPYGNVDVPATLAHRPDLLPIALAQRSEALVALGVETTPVLTSPSGYLDSASIRAARPESRVLVTDRMFDAPAPVVADADGRRLVVASYGATQGSPGPGTSLTSVGIRQRILSEAAVRVIKNKREPLVVVLPLDWALDDANAFWGGLDVPWLDLGTLDDAATAATPTRVSPDDLDYTALQERRELDAPTIDAVADLILGGDTLQDLLLDNNEIGGTLTEEALTGLSYFVRNAQIGGRLAVLRSRDWVDTRLGGVRITTPRGVTLASSSGDFQVTLVNDLPHRVAVSVRAESDAGIEVDGPERIVLPPGGRDTVLLRARTTTNAVHNVTLLVTDPSGRPLGSSEELPIRPTEVSGVIWLIMGTGAGLLFLAIGVRLVRRVAAARRGEAGAGRRGSAPAPDAQTDSLAEAGAAVEAG